jgi:uncharacterized membrane protein
MAKKQLVIAVYENEDAADQAVKDLKQWDKATKEIKLGAIGVLAKDKKGKIKTHKLGARKTKTGAAIGAVAGVLSGGLTLLGGAVAGGILGAFFKKGLGMSKDDLARLDSALDGGKAAVAVLAEADEAQSVSAKLGELGGVVETHEVTEEALEEAAEAVESISEGEAA